MMLHQGLECSKSRIVLKDKMTVVTPSLFKLFPMMLVEEFQEFEINACKNVTKQKLHR